MQTSPILGAPGQRRYGYNCTWLTALISILYCATLSVSGQEPTPVERTLTVLIDGPGEVQVNPSGTLFTNGQTVELTALCELPPTGTNTVRYPSAFAGWQTGDGSKWTQTIQVVMNGDKTITARFFDVVRWVAPGGDSPAHGANQISSISAPAGALFAYAPDGSASHSEPVIAPSISAVDPNSGYVEGFFNDGSTAKAVSWGPTVSNRWSHPVPATAGARGLAPVVGVSRVYFPGDDGIYAFDRNGTFLWKQHQPGRMVMDSDERLWVMRGETLEMLAPDGSVRRRFTGLKETWPAIGPNNDVWAFWQSNWGPMIRSHNADGEWSATVYLPGKGQGAPVIGSDYTIYTPTDAGFVAINRYLGQQWLYDTRAFYSVLGADARIYIASERGLEAINIHSGIPEWIIFAPGFLNYAPTMRSGLLTATRLVEREGALTEQVYGISAGTQAGGQAWSSRHGNAGNSGFTRQVVGSVPILAELPVQRGYPGERRTIELQFANDEFPPEQIGIAIVSAPAGVALNGRMLSFNIGNWRIVLRAFLLSDPSRYSTMEIRLEESTAPARPVPRPIQPIQVVAGDTVTVTNVFSIPFTPGPTNNVMTFTFLSAPEGARMTETNSFSWVPTLAQADQEYLIRVVATRATTPPVSATNEFKITVIKPGSNHPDMSVLVLRVDFPDLPGHSLNREDAIDLFNRSNGIAPYFRDSSYGAINLHVSEATVPEVLRLPQFVASYRAGLGFKVMEDARPAAEALGIQFEDFYRVVIVVPDISLEMDWKSERWDQTTIIFNHYNFEVVARELARTYGFEAASSWIPTPDGGIVVEGGDQYDLLGSGADSRADLNPRLKHWAGWLPDESVQTITNSGMYRVYQFDDPNAPVGQTEKPLVLKVGKNESLDYWVTFRDKTGDTNSAALRAFSVPDGAYVLLGEKTKPQTLLVDVNRGTGSDPLLHVGGTYADPHAGVTLNVLGSGGVAPERYLDVQVSLTTGQKQAQSIQFFTPADITFGAPAITLQGPSSSGLPVSYEVVSGKATVTGNLLTATGAGPVTVRAVQPGNASFDPAPPVERTFNVLKGRQFIDLPPLPSLRFGAEPIELRASASSGLPVITEIVTGPAAIQEGRLRATGAGEVTLRITQPGNEDYFAAPTLYDNFTIQKGLQSISFELPSTLAAHQPLPLSATATSRLPVSFRIVSGPGEIQGESLVAHAVGTVVVEATQAGNENYESAPVIQRTIQVLPLPRIQSRILDSKLKLEWENIPGFLIEASPSLQGPWQELAVPLESSSLQLNLLGERRFFRLRSR